MTATALDAAASITEPATTSIPSTIPAPAGPNRPRAWVC